MMLSMQEHNRLDICINFILNNSDHSEYLTDRFTIDSRRINQKQIFISLDPNLSKNIKNIKHAIEKGASGFITPFPVTRKKSQNIYSISGGEKYWKYIHTTI